MVGRTTFVIAHRLHTITNVDQVFVLKDGEIVDQGSHTQLVDKPGFYKTMWDKQQKEAAGGTVDYGGISKAEVNSLLDLLERFESTLPTEVASMLYQLRPRQEEEDDAELDDIRAAEVDDDDGITNKYLPLGNEAQNSEYYTSGPEPFDEFVTDKDY